MQGEIDKDYLREGFLVFDFEKGNAHRDLRVLLFRAGDCSFNNGGSCFRHFYFRYRHLDCVLYSDCDCTNHLHL